MRLAAGLAAARAVGGLARATGRGGGTSLPGKVLTRVEPHAIERLAARLPRGSVVVSATNGKTTTAAMISSVLELAGTRLVHNRAGANMVGGVASALAAAARRGGRALDGDLGLFEVDEFWLGPVVEEVEPRALLLGNLFRDQLDRYGELETIADRWAAIVAARPPGTRLVLNADDPLVADLGPRRAGRCTSASRTARWRCRSSSTPRTPSTAAAAGTPTPTRPSTSPTSAATTAPTAGSGARSRRWRRSTSSCAGSAARRSRCAPATRSAASSCRCPGSTTSTTRSARRRCAWRSRSRSTGWSPAWRPSRPRSGGRRRSTSAAGRPRSCWSRTRPAPTRCCAR